jgi:hypothetical protein
MKRNQNTTQAKPRQALRDFLLRLLFAPGSSLGNGRPKASVREKDGTLTIAKFRARTYHDHAASICNWPETQCSPS